MAEKPKPKQGDYKTLKEWAVALRNWRAAQHGSEEAPDRRAPKPSAKPPGPPKTGPSEGSRKKDKAGNEYIFKSGRWQLATSVKASAQRNMLKGKGSTRNA